MPTNTPLVRIAIYGSDGIDDEQDRGCGLWATGYAAALKAAGAEPVLLEHRAWERSWEDFLEGCHGVVFSGISPRNAQEGAEAERFCEWCRVHEFPLLAVDEGLHTLNVTCSGSTFRDLPIDLPDALQHRHPPEKGVRHAIAVVPGTRLADFYGEGEIVVNSEHRRAVNRVARGFRISARALDGVIEAIESESKSWFALGVQWHPASGTASGLDIQLFRGLVEACVLQQQTPRTAPCLAA